jgi:two-component system, cell cycle sensor histidine kinase and response regulator CckA
VAENRLSLTTMSHSTDLDIIRDLQQELADNEAARRLLLDSALDCIVCTDEQAIITEFNAAAERVFRIPRSEAVGKDLPALLFPASQDSHRAQLFGTLTTGGVELLGTRLEISAKRADGIEFPAEFTVTRVLTKRRPSFVIHVRDISTRKRAEQAVVWLAALVESSQDAIISKDMNGRIMSWNRGAEQMYGYTANEAIDQHISMLVPPDRPDEVPNILRKLRQGVETKNLETVRVSKDGKRLDVLLTVSPVRDTDGRLTGASVIARDITAEKAAQEALRKATETSIYSSPVPIIAVDTEGRVTTWNPAAEAVFGWNQQEVLGKPLPTVPSEEAERASQLHRRLLAGETLTGVEVRRRTKSGSLVTISLSGSPLWDGESQVRGIIGFHTDITARKNAEEALRQAEEKYRSIFENAVEGIYQATPEGKYISANPALARMLGFDSPEELIASCKDISRQEYINPEVRSTFIAAIEEQEVVLDFEYEAHRKDGKKTWLSTSAHAVRDAKGRMIHLEGTVQDISEKRELEHQVRQMQKIEAIGRLAGGVAHDFNNILMAISSYAELLGKKTTDEATRRYVEEMAKAVNRGSALTQGLLTFSRKQVSSPKVLDLNTLIAQQLEMLKRLIPENIELKFVPSSAMTRIKADPSQVEQVVMNLVINARDAMATGGVVTIKTGKASLDATEDSGMDPALRRNHVLLSVSDNGCGMDAETKSHLFEPFYTTKEQGKGTGLGLATVFGIVKQSMGHISVESELQQGTTFKIYFPPAEDAVQETGSEENISALAGTETILLVEDEASVREPAAEYLVGQGYSVLKACHGPEALEIAERHHQPIHLLLTDLIMPHMSGRYLSERVAMIHPEAKTIFMSGYSRNVLTDTQNLDPSYTLLQKPFRLNMLGQCIRRTLDRKQAASAD